MKFKTSAYSFIDLFVVLLLSVILVSTVSGKSSDPGKQHDQNKSLIVRDGKLLRSELWQPFDAYLLDILTHHKDGLVYVFLGRKAQEFADMVPDTNYKIMVSHPASAAYNGSKWDCNDMWNQINNYLNEKGRQPISW